MVGKRSGGAAVRVADGVYRRGEGYSVAVYDPASKKKVWHGPRCGPECAHDRIVSLESAKSAKRQLEERKRRMAGKSDETVRGWADRWLTVFPRKAASTNQHNAERVSGFVGAFEDRTLRSLREDEVWAWASGPNGGAVKEVRAMLNDAIKLRLLDENPLRHFQTPARRGRRDIRVLTTDELDLLVECAHESWPDYGPRMAAMIEMAAWTGVRPGELFMFSVRPGARVNYVDLDAGSIDVGWQFNTRIGEVTRPKWGSQRRVVLLPRAAAAARSLIAAEAHEPDGMLFKTERGRPYTGRTHHYYFDPVRRAFAAKLPADHWLRIRIAEQGARGSLDFYELRHFFGTALAQPPKGVRPATPYEIAQQLGHKDGGALAMQVYIHAEEQRVVSELGAAWADQEPRRAAG